MVIIKRALQVVVTMAVRCEVPCQGVRLRVHMCSQARAHIGNLAWRGALSSMVTRVAERHGRGSSALRGKRQDQQPDQDLSNQTNHPITLA